MTFPYPLKPVQLGIIGSKTIKTGPIKPNNSPASNTQYRLGHRLSLSASKVFFLPVVSPSGGDWHAYPKV
jgi:hypothetical protein